MNRNPHRLRPPGRALAATALALLALCAALAAPAAARIELVTLPASGASQLTIYNSVDLTLVRDDRPLTLRKGTNRIEFSWANTRIDPTSALLEPLAETGKIRVVETVFPPRVANTLVWTVESEVAGQVPMRVSYFTSGITWAADHALVMDAAETEAEFRTLVAVANSSGEDYAGSQVRLVVGKVNLVERIDDLATRQDALREEIFAMESEKSSFEDDGAMDMMMPTAGLMAAPPAPTARPKKVAKEGLAEHFIFTVEGRETIENGWTKRLQAVAAPKVAVASVFRHEDFRLGPEAVRFVTFRNEAGKGLGETPLPDGTLRILKTDAAGNLQFLGATSQAYVPIDATVEVNLGADREVKVEIRTMDYRIDAFAMNHRGDPAGWDTRVMHEVRVRNFKRDPVRLEIRRRHAGVFEIASDRPHEMEDRATVCFKLEVPAGSDLVFPYTVRTFHGVNAERR